MLADCGDKGIVLFAKSLRDRLLPKSTEIGPKLDRYIQSTMHGASRDEVEKERTRIAAKIESRFDEFNERHLDQGPRVMLDIEERDPYSRSSVKGPLNRIHIKSSDGRVSDIADHSPMIAALRPFRLIRAYTYHDDVEAKQIVDRTVAEVIGEVDGDEA